MICVFLGIVRVELVDDCFSDIGGVVWVVVIVVGVVVGWFGWGLLC